MRLARGYVEPNAAIFEKARGFEAFGMGASDALHVAAAEYAEADYFVTCDDKLTRRVHRAQTTLEAILPTDLIKREGL